MFFRGCGAKGLNAETLSREGKISGNSRGFAPLRYELISFCNILMFIMVTLL
jgi:hypothetical protein